jgi:hypothetical protein
MHWGVFAISAAHLYQNYLEEPPNPCETSERMNFNIIKLFIYWYLMSFFHKKMSQNFWATIMPFEPVTFTGPNFFFGPTWPSFQALSGLVRNSKIMERNGIFGYEMDMVRNDYNSSHTVMWTTVYKCRHQRHSLLETDTLKTQNYQGYTLFYTYSGGHAKLI